MRLLTVVVVDQRCCNVKACSGVFFNKGENCIAAGRLFVEDSLHDKFISLVVNFAGAAEFICE